MKSITNMFRGVARNVFSSLANGEEKEDAPDENDEIVVTHSSPPIRVRYNDPCCCTGWPGMCVVAVQINNNMLPLIGLRLTCSARDQNWGNTGHSMMSLVMINRSGQLKNERKIGVTLHEEIDFQLSLEKDDEFLKCVEIGDRIGIWAISAPYGGYECICNKAMLAITITSNWKRRRRMMMFLYASQLLTCSDTTEVFTTSYLAGFPSGVYCVFSNRDLVRMIVEFL